MGKGAPSKGYIQNLKTKEILKFTYNPESYEYGYSSEYAVIKAPGSPHPIYQFVGGNERTITTTLLLDGREQGAALVRKQMEFFGAWHPANTGYKRFAPPPEAMFGLSWFVKKVLIKDVQFNVVMFNDQVSPIRVECALTMETMM